MGAVLIGPVLLSVLYSMGNVLIICGLAVLMVRKRVLTADATKSLGAIVFNLFLPCLLFCQLGEGISLDSLHHLWFLPFAAIVGIGMGFGLGALLLRFVITPRSPEMRRVIMGACAFCNSGNLPLVILAALAKTSPFLAHDSAAGGRAFQYVFLYTFGWNICFLGAGDRYMFGRRGGPAAAGAAAEEGPPPPTPAGAGRGPPGGAGRYVPLKHEHESDAEAGLELREGAEAAGDPPPPPPPAPPPPPDAADEDEAAAADDERPAPRPVAPRLPTFRLRRRRPSEANAALPPAPPRPSAASLAREFLSPPMTAMLLAVFIGLTTPLKRLVFGPEAPLRGLFAAVELVGNATVPSGTIVLAATLAHSSGVGGSRPAPPAGPPPEGGPGAKEEAAAAPPDESPSYDGRTVLCVCLARLVASPLAGMALWAAARAAGLIPPDKLFDLVLLIEAAMPTAQNIGLFAIVRHSREAAAIGRLLLVEYMASIATITLALAVFQLVVFA